MGSYLEQFMNLIHSQRGVGATPPRERLGYAERLIAAGQRPSQNVQIAPPGPDYYDYPPDPRTAWTPLSDEVNAVKFENSIGLPSALVPGHERQTRAMPDLSAGLYSTAHQTDMGPYPPVTVRIPQGGGEFIDAPIDPSNPEAQASNWRAPLNAPLPPRRPY